MKRLPPAKRNQLIGVLVATAALICGVYFLLINPQNTKNGKLALQIKSESDRLQQYKEIIKKKEETTVALAALNEQLERAEEDVANGDLYVWAYETLRHFKAGYSKVEIPTQGQPTQGDCDLIAGFPYRQIRFSLSGTSYYHDLGKFVSDFENKFPHCRVVNISVDPAGASPGGAEKLNFHMDIVALAKPNS
jgi:Tfp pilus assembly protein PilO